MTMIECNEINVGQKKKTLIGLKVYHDLNNGNNLITTISPLLQDGEDFEYWKQLYLSDKEKYKKEKVRIGEEIKNEFVLLYPELFGKMKLIDSATPITYERFLGAYKGSYMAFMLTTKSKQMMHDGKIKGIKNCFMAGQWLITPGGLPTAVVTGKFAIQRICKIEKKDFIK